MIDSHILKLLVRTAPSYHLVSEANAKTSTVCICARCTKYHRELGECCRLGEALAAHDYPLGYAAVSRLGTCDRAIDVQMALPLDAPADDGGEVFP